MKKHAAGDAEKRQPADLISDNSDSDAPFTNSVEAAAGEVSDDGEKLGDTLGVMLRTMQHPANRLRIMQVLTDTELASESKISAISSMLEKGVFVKH